MGEALTENPLVCDDSGVGDREVSESRKGKETQESLAGLGRQAGRFQPTIWGQALGQSLQPSGGPREDRAAHRQSWREDTGHPGVSGPQRQQAGCSAGGDPRAPVQLPQTHRPPVFS